METAPAGRSFEAYTDEIACFLQGVACKEADELFGQECQYEENITRNVDAVYQLNSATYRSFSPPQATDGRLVEKISYDAKHPERVVFTVAEGGAYAKGHALQVYWHRKLSSKAGHPVLCARIHVLDTASLFPVGSLQDRVFAETSFSLPLYLRKFITFPVLLPSDQVPHEYFAENRREELRRAIPRDRTFNAYGGAKCITAELMYDLDVAKGRLILNEHKSQFYRSRVTVTTNISAIEFEAARSAIADLGLADLAAPNIVDTVEQRLHSKGINNIRRCVDSGGGATLGKPLSIEALIAAQLADKAASAIWLGTAAVRRGPATLAGDAFPVYTPRVMRGMGTNNQQHCTFSLDHTSASASITTEFSRFAGIYLSAHPVLRHFLMVPTDSRGLTEVCEALWWASGGQVDGNTITNDADLLEAHQAWLGVPSAVTTTCHGLQPLNTPEEKRQKVFGSFVAHGPSKKYISLLSQRLLALCIDNGLSIQQDYERQCAALSADAAHAIVHRAHALVRILNKWAPEVFPGAANYAGALFISQRIGKGTAAAEEMAAASQCVERRVLMAFSRRDVVENMPVTEVPARGVVLSIPSDGRKLRVWLPDYQIGETSFTVEVDWPLGGGVESPPLHTTIALMLRCCRTTHTFTAKCFYPGGLPQSVIAKRVNCHSPPHAALADSGLSTAAALARANTAPPHSIRGGEATAIRRSPTSYTLQRNLIQNPRTMGAAIPHHHHQFTSLHNAIPPFPHRAPSSAQ